MLSLNDCMAVGPNALCELYDCLIFWRAIEVALMVDLQKAYQAIHTGPKELHLRRFLFRQDPSLQWEIFAFTRATFGDVSAGLVLEVAKRNVAELGTHLDPVAAQQLADYTYVDDSVLGGSKRDVERMRGNKMEQGYMGTVPKILALGGMRVKFMAVAGTKDEWEAKQLGGKTLGVNYILSSDQIVFRIKPSYYAAKGKSSDQCAPADDPRRGPNTAAGCWIPSADPTTRPQHGHGSI